MNAVWSVVTFILGIVITWTLMNKYDTKIFDMWDTADILSANQMDLI